MQNASNNGFHKTDTRKVTHFLKENEKMASLLPAIHQINAIWQDCLLLSPALAASCAVLKFDEAQLVLSVPNTAIAAKLKQQLPKLQQFLVNKGWHLDSIRFKVLMKAPPEKPSAAKMLQLPAQAATAFSSLNQTLDNNSSNAGLKQAIEKMLARLTSPT